MSRLTFPAAILAAFLTCGSLALQAEPPSGWHIFGSDPKSYDSNTDWDASYQGQPSVILLSNTPAVKGFGTVMQCKNAKEYRSKRVRFSAWVKTENVVGWAGLWMRVDVGKDWYRLDNMYDRALRGTLVWQKCEVVLDVPEASTGVCMGMLVAGPGAAWMNNYKIEEVDDSVPVTRQ